MNQSHLEAAKEINRLSLIIESAVRVADPVNYAAVLAALMATRAAEARPEIDADKIVAEFENIFGKLTATERRWLTRRIAGQEV